MDEPLSKAFGNKPSDQPGATSDVAPGQRLDGGALPATPVESVGSRIGPYKLLQQIGEGGMGVVFMAEQQEPVRRMVALKVIKAGMDSAQVLARFEQERQALALMDHPNIAKVLAADTTSSGRPYFVMELVKGIPITRYCDEQRLSPKQRLELFVPVCQAIQHAHQKGIIHRDLKPSNVLVASYDGKPVPKVIDFGVAKAMAGKLTERTLFTGFGGIVGTLEYMSPEQAEFNALDIDTRSDIYSLGVMLYELLTGTTPLTRPRLKEAALTEVLRLIREEEPPRPSTRLSESKDSLASVSAQRQMEPSGLLKAMRGEVDWIVMKALEKDRTRRYESANGLARDIQRYLADEPVEAGPPSTSYRLRKLAWKHRRGLATAAALLLLIVLGAAVSTILAMWAFRAEGHARTAQKQAVEERDKAQQAVADAEAVLAFFQDKVLSAGRPLDEEGGQGHDVSLRKAVDAAEKHIAESFKDRPLVEASIRDTLGMTYKYLGEYPQAIQQHERALALRESKLSSDHPDTLNSRNKLAMAYEHAGRIADAIRLHQQTLKQREDKLGLDHPDTLSSRHNLALAYLDADRTADAIRLLEQTLKQREAKLGADNPDTLYSRNELARAYYYARRTAEAIRLHEQTLKQSEAKLGSDHHFTLITRSNLALEYQDAGRTADAIRLHEQTLKQSEARLGNHHSDTLQIRINLAEAYLDAGEFDKARPLLDEDRPLLEPQLREATNLYRQRLQQQGPKDINTLLALRDMAQILGWQGRFDEAEPLLWRVLAGLGDRKREDPIVAFTERRIARAGGGARPPATADWLRSWRAERKQGGDGGAAVATALEHFGRQQLDRRNWDEAEPLLRDGLDWRQAKEPDAWTTFNSQSQLGEALLGQKKFADAELLLLKGYQGMKERQDKIPPQGIIRLNEALERLVKLYEATGKKGEADKWRKEQQQSRKANANDADKK